MIWGASGLYLVFFISSIVVSVCTIAVIIVGRRINKNEILRFGNPSTIFRIFTNEIWRSRSDLSAIQTRSAAKISRLIKLNLRKRRTIKDSLLFTALILIAAAFARPQWGMRQEPVVQSGIDLVVLLDTSESMKVEDIAPDRLSKAQSEISALLDNLQGNRVALVGFASTTKLHCPLTLDFRGLRSILQNSLSYGIGTDIEAAINEGLRVVRTSESKTKAFVILSDGENHQGDLDAAVRSLREAGVRVYAIGIGTSEGGPIPEKSETGEETYKKRNGELVWSRLDETALQKIAEETSGAYFSATGTEAEASAIANLIQQFEKTEFSQKVTTHEEDRFGVFLILAILLMSIETALSEYKKTSFQEDD